VLHAIGREKSLLVPEVANERQDYYMDLFANSLNTHSLVMQKLDSMVLDTGLMEEQSLAQTESLW
jgi:hypothetical protein